MSEVKLVVASKRTSRNGPSRHISKAQKCSRNNYCEVFQLSHSAKKYPKGFSPKLEISFFSELETSEKTNLPLEISFLKKVFVKKVVYYQKANERRFRLIKRILQTESFKKFKGVLSQASACDGNTYSICHSYKKAEPFTLPLN